MKLIIDISEEDYKRCTVMASAIRNGIPLDSVKAEFINRYPKNFADEPELGGYACAFSLNKVLKILDNIGKESEGKQNE